MKTKLSKRPLNYLKQFLMLGLFMTFSHLVWADKITVTADRQTVEMGDVITLMVETDFQVNQELNLDALQDQFEILNQQQSNQVQIINGKYDSFTQWRIQLLPKHIGKLIIPPFRLNGVSSEPYPISVKKAQYTDSNRPYFLEAQVDKKSVYVQEQVIYTLRFYHKGSLINGNIRPPKFDDALVEQIKEQSVYGKTINNQQFTVYEWQYAFFPQTSGKLNIAGPSFTGMVQLRGGQKGVRALADEISIEVLPKPVKTGGYWLPANQLTITQKWDTMPQTVHVGDSLRRVITIQAKGLKVSQLPEIATPNGDNFKVYTDSKKPSQTMNSDGITATIEISQAVVPTKEGSLQIPDLNIQWWNTQSKKIETASLQTEAIKIWPANSSIPSVVQTNQDGVGQVNQLSTAPSSQTTIPNSTVVNTSTPWYWPVLVIILLLMWLLTLALFFINQRKVKQLEMKAQSATQVHFEAKNKVIFDKSWCDLPLPEFYAEMLKKLRVELNIPVIEAIPNPQLISAIRQLEAHLFAGEKLGYKTMQTICDNWAALVNKHNQVKKEDKKQELTSLYNK